MVSKQPMEDFYALAREEMFIRSLIGKSRSFYKDARKEAV